MGRHEFYRLECFQQRIAAGDNPQIMHTGSAESRAGGTEFPQFSQTKFKSFQAEPQAAA